MKLQKKPEGILYNYLKICEKAEKEKKGGGESPP